jgi:flavin reductase (DIM6/NTAB) family NADH-FMN oxidoreductase RutF
MQLGGEKMKHVNYMEVADDAMKQIRRGAFLTVQADDRINLMTIGWASFGLLWGRPMTTIMVRKTRFTFGIIEKSGEFTISVPHADLSAALDFCGSKSGRNVDKLKACNLELVPGERVKTPVVKCKGIHFECAIVYKTAVDPANLVESYAHLYPEKDYHTMYFGEIKYAYSTDDGD